MNAAAVLCVLGLSVGLIRGQEIVAICPELDTPLNGMISYSPDLNVQREEGTVATYSCETGYELSGGVTRTCEETSGVSESGLWSGTDHITCEPVSCGSPLSISNGVLAGPPTSILFGGMVIYSCNPGYQLSGSATVTCQASGSWSTLPTCIAICPELTLINGMISYSPNTTPRLEGTVATHSCDTGYELSERPERTCQSDGTWSGGSITCVATCDDLPALANGMISYNPNTTPRLEGTTAMHSCDTGYELSGGTVRTCRSDRTWSGGSITCVVTNTGLCPPPPSIPNGSHGILGMTGVGGTATYSCDPGYEPSGSSDTVTCQAGGIWSTPQLTCIAICDDLPALANGMISYSPNTTPRLERTVATHSCDTGYLPQGGMLRVCQPDRTWSGGIITCELICPDLTPPANGAAAVYSDTTIPRDEGSTATYSCNSGYVVTGNTVRICTATGWDGSDPVCTAFCDDLTLSNGTISYSPNAPPRLEGTVAMHSCDSGFVRNGETKRTCASSSSGGLMWSGTQVTCRTELDFCADKEPGPVPVLDPIVWYLVGAIGILLLLLITVMVLFVVILTVRKKQLKEARARVYDVPDQAYHEGESKVDLDGADQGHTHTLPMELR